MTVIGPTTTLGALVTEHPELARELERRGLDYCCGGRATLADACAALDLSVADVVRRLVVECDDTPPPDWASMDAPTLVDHLVDTHHRYLWDELPRLTALVAKITTVHGERHPELAEVSSLVDEIRADLEPHLLKEERILFPMIREGADGGTVRGPVTVMQREHDRLGELLAELRRVTSDYRPPADGCASYFACFAALEALETDTHLHVHKENNVLFPMVERPEGE